MKRLIHGLNHIAVMTEGLDRFIAFYAQVFQTETLFRQDSPDHLRRHSASDLALMPVQRLLGFDCGLSLAPRD